MLGRILAKVSRAPKTFRTSEYGGLVYSQPRVSVSNLLFYWVKKYCPDGNEPTLQYGYLALEEIESSIQVLSSAISFLRLALTSTTKYCNQNRPPLSYSGALTSILP
jgi:hypothetical protein